MAHNRHLFRYLPLILSVLCFTCTKPKAEDGKEVYSTHSYNISDPGWDSKAWKDDDVLELEGKPVESENTMSVFSRWNADSLFFFFRVEDTCLRAYQTEKDHAELYLDDMVEVLIDTQNDKDSCWAADDIVYHINLLGVKKDDRGTPECLTDPSWDGNGRITVQLLGTLNDTTDTDQGYMVTLALPWAELGQEPFEGLTMGVNFANGDNDGKGRQLFDWVGAWPMRSPYAFGNLILIKNRVNDKL